MESSANHQFCQRLNPALYFPYCFSVLIVFLYTPPPCKIVDPILWQSSISFPFLIHPLSFALFIPLLVWCFPPYPHLPFISFYTPYFLLLTTIRVTHHSCTSFSRHHSSWTPESWTPPKDLTGVENFLLQKGENIKFGFFPNHLRCLWWPGQPMAKRKFQALVPARAYGQVTRIFAWPWVGLRSDISRRSDRWRQWIVLPASCSPAIISSSSNFSFSSGLRFLILGYFELGKMKSKNNVVGLLQIGGR